MYALLAAATDVLHALAMIGWALGLPLLLWHRWPRLSTGYTAYAAVFVVVSQASHTWLGECFLTTLARELTMRSGAPGSSERVLFTTRVVELVAGIRPSQDLVVLLWEAAILTTAVAVFMHLWHVRSGRRHGPPGRSVTVR